MTDCLEVRALVEQDGDDWCGVTEWGYEIFLQRWPDCVTVRAGPNSGFELSAHEACTLGRWLIEYGTKLKTSEAGVASPPATGETPASD